MRYLRYQVRDVAKPARPVLPRSLLQVLVIQPGQSTHIQRDLISTVSAIVKCDPQQITKEGDTEHSPRFLDYRSLEVGSPCCVS